METSSLILFRELAMRLGKTIAELEISESEKWCSFNQKGGKRFAYFLLAKKQTKISVWCLGNSEEIKYKYAGKVKFLARQTTKGGFGKDFQISFEIDNQTNIEDIVALIAEIANSWTKEELFSAYNLYCKIPIDEISSNNEQIVEFAMLLDKTTKEVAKRLKNFSKLDAARSILDFENENKDDVNVVNYFNNQWNEAVYESEQAVLKFENKLQKLTGKERESIVKQRVNQNFFRTAVLTSYQNKCCITGLPIKELLNASHIIPWSKDENNRLNPHNGLCLNALHDRAFDRGFITVTTDYKLKISKSITMFLDSRSVMEYFIQFENKDIVLPNRFLPAKEFLEYHNQNIFRK
jgi:putative restriction endonuclease